MTLVITTLREVMAGKGQPLINYALPSGMRFRSAANFVGDAVDKVSLITLNAGKSPVFAFPTVTPDRPKHEILTTYHFG